MKDYYQPHFDPRRIDYARAQLPEGHQPYTDIYFVRTGLILKAMDWNPWMRAQVFIRKGIGDKVSGIYDAIAGLIHYTDFLNNGGRIWSIEEGDPYNDTEECETIMRIEGRAQDFVELETLYLGLLSHYTTAVNDGKWDLDLPGVKERMREIVRRTQSPQFGTRPVTYFGARHYHWRANGPVLAACWDGGASTSSTDAGAQSIGERSAGTIPHVLENICAFYSGEDNAVLEASRLFHDHIDPRIKRMSLIDYRNREITDALAVSNVLGNSFFAHRVDTHGGNLAEGALPNGTCPEAEQWRKDGFYLPRDEDPIAKYWYGNGVTVTGVAALRRALDAAGFSKHGIFLTSGFANPEKVRAFTMAEQLLGMKLYDGLGVGEVSPGRFATMDVVAIGNDPGAMIPIFKKGRPPKPNPLLRPAIGTFD